MAPAHVVSKGHPSPLSAIKYVTQLDPTANIKVITVMTVGEVRLRPGICGPQQKQLAKLQKCGVPEGQAALPNFAVSRSLQTVPWFGWQVLGRDHALVTRIFWKNENSKVENGGPGSPM